jgi:hypothetical protein
MLTTIATCALLGGLAAPSPLPAPETPGQRYDVFGFEVCIGTQAEPGTCDLRLPAPSPQPAPTPPATQTAGRTRPIELEMFGKKLCIGDGAPAARCDWWLRNPERTQGA